MTDPITRTQLVNASRDADDIAKAINGPASGEGSTFANRVGNTLKTWSRLVSELTATVASIVAASTGNIVGTNVIFTKNYASFELAVAVAQANGAALFVDSITTLTDDTVIPDEIPTIYFVGGAIDTDGHQLTFGAGGVIASSYQIFKGDGPIRGTIWAPEILVEWWVDGSGAENNRSAFQYALDHVNNSVWRHAVVRVGFATFDIGDHGVVSTGADQPQIIGSPDGYPSPDSCNLIMTPSASEPAITIVGNNSPCGGSCSGFFIDGNANTTGVRIAGAVGFRVNNSGSSTVGTHVYLANDAAERYTENDRITLTIPGLGKDARAINIVKSTGDISFSGTEIDLDVGLNPGVRSVPVIEIATSDFVYNGRLDLFVHNNGATNVALISDASAAPLWFASGSIRIETSDEYPVAVMEPSGSNMYYGGTGPFCQGVTLTNIDISKVVYCTTFAYQPDGRLITTGAVAYQQKQVFFANDGVALAPIFGGVNHCQFTGSIFNPADSSYHSEFSLRTCVDQFGPSNGQKGGELYSTGPDTHSYGNPSATMNSDKRPLLSNVSWPSGVQFVALYTARQL
jgi:hypothetical protein